MFPGISIPRALWIVKRLSSIPALPMRGSQVFKSVDSGGVLDKTSLGKAPTQSPCLCSSKSCNWIQLIQLRGVRLYDRLVKVNGKSQQSSELARLVVSDSELELTVERPGAQAGLTRMDENVAE